MSQSPDRSSETSGDGDRAPEASGDMPRRRRTSSSSMHDFAPVNTGEMYGFALWALAWVFFAVYLVWAFLPEYQLRAIGMAYFPDRHWALVLPALLMAAYATTNVVYLAINLRTTPDWHEACTWTDPHAHALPDRGDWSVLPDAAVGTPEISDLPLTLVNKMLYLPAYRRAAQVRRAMASTSALVSPGPSSSLLREGGGLGGGGLVRSASSLREASIDTTGTQFVPGMFGSLEALTSSTDTGGGNMYNGASGPVSPHGAALQERGDFIVGAEAGAHGQAHMYDTPESGSPTAHEVKMLPPPSALHLLMSRGAMGAMAGQDTLAGAAFALAGESHGSDLAPHAPSRSSSFTQRDSSGGKGGRGGLRGSGKGSMTDLPGLNSRFAFSALGASGRGAYGGGGGSSVAVGPSSSLPHPPVGLRVHAGSDIHRWDSTGRRDMSASPSQGLGIGSLMRRSTSEGQHLAGMSHMGGGGGGVLLASRVSVPLPIASAPSSRFIRMPPTGGSGVEGGEGGGALRVWNTISSPLASAGSTGSSTGGLGDSASMGNAAAAGDAPGLKYVAGVSASPASFQFPSGGGLPVPMGAVGLAGENQGRPQSRGGTSSAFHSGGGVSSAFHSGEGVGPTSAGGGGGDCSSQQVASGEGGTSLRGLTGGPIAPSMYDDGGLDESGLLADSIIDSEGGMPGWPGQADSHSEGGGSGSRRSTGVDIAMLAQLLGSSDAAGSLSGRGVFANAPRVAPAQLHSAEGGAVALPSVTGDAPYLGSYKGRLAVNLGDLGDISQPDLERLLRGRPGAGGR